MKKESKMYATEFQTIINEPYIYIPNYEAFKGHEVRVVLLNLDNEIKIKEPINDSNFIIDIINNPRHIETNDKFLSRDESNER
jgi:hypothetical protein